MQDLPHQGDAGDAEADGQQPEGRLQVADAQVFGEVVVAGEDCDVASASFLVSEAAQEVGTVALAVSATKRVSSVPFIICTAPASMAAVRGGAVHSSCDSEVTAGSVPGFTR